MTHNIDIVVEISTKDVAQIPVAFPPESFYSPPLETSRIEIRRRQHSHFNLIHSETGFKADLYLDGENNLHRWAMARRRKITLGEETARIAPIECVIIRKLVYYRAGGSDKHLDAIQGMIAASSDMINFNELERGIGEQGLQTEARQAGLEK